MMTNKNIEISDQVVINRIGGYINQFYKILPIKESGELTLPQYIASLQREMLGCGSLVTVLNDDPRYLTLLSILEYMLTNDCDVATVKSEVFKAINILKKLQTKLQTNSKE